jgi:hypothetical protein
MTGVIFHTDGRGLWSDESRAIRIVDMRLWIDDPEWTDFGELKVYFDLKSWNIDKHGLIYTDDRFERELRKFLNLHGLPGKDVCYSEQGMQGYDYVSLDAGPAFIKAWTKKFNGSNIWYQL